MIFKFLNYLQIRKFDYCLINGYVDVARGIISDSDIDLLFRKNDFLKIEKIIQYFCESENYLVVQIYHQEVWAKNIFIFDPVSNELLNLDIYGELSRKGVVFFEEKEIFSSLDIYENIPILSPEKELINYLIKKLDKNDLTRFNFNYLHSLYFKSKDAVEKKLIQFFPFHYAIVSKAFLSDNFTGIRMNREILLTDFNSLKTMNFKQEFLDIFRIIKRIMHPTGFTVSFLGPDGSGKSTIINDLFNNCLPFRRKEYFHLKPILQKKNAKPMQNPHNNPPYSKLKSYVKLLYFIYQYNLGWLKNIISLKIRSSLIIFDRYFDDLLVDNNRYRYSGSKAIAKIVRKFIPKPTIYFILTADSQVIYKRKQEVPFTELERQIKAYKSLADGKRYFDIDVNRAPKEITKEIITIIMNKMNEPY
jgi:thymidylate kinase